MRSQRPMLTLGHGKTTTGVHKNVYTMLLVQCAKWVQLQYRTTTYERNASKWCLNLRSYKRAGAL